MKTTRYEEVRILLAVVLFSVVSIYILTDSLASWTTPATTVRRRQQVTIPLLLGDTTATVVAKNEEQTRQFATQKEGKENEITVATTETSRTQISQRSNVATKRRSQFPRWGSDNDTISVDAILDFLLHSSIHATSPQRPSSPQYRPTTDHPHATTVNYWFPATAYVVTREGGLFTSLLHRDILHELGHNTVRDKLRPTELAMQRALQRLLDDDDDASRWPLLQKLLVGEPNNSSSSNSNNMKDGFVFLAWYGDYTGCNHHNWVSSNQSVVSIPLFTPAARIDCTHAFPFPNFQMIRDVQEMENAREEAASSNRTTASSHQQLKIRQVVWRGSLTGAVLMDPDTNSTSGYRTPRWQLVQQYGNTNNNKNAHFDIAATRLPNRQAHMADLLGPELGQEQPALATNYMNATTTNSYLAVLDIDGNSWSSRFPRLLCGDAVVVKVAPTFVDTLFSTTQAGTHYIPVHANRSNLEAVAAWITDPTSEPYVRRVVAQAQAWCRAHVRSERVETDMLDSWERYLELSSGVDAWRGVAERVLGEPLLRMEPIDRVLLSSTLAGDRILEEQDERQ